jgi:ketosteroid isomerase-like protein
MTQTGEYRMDRADTVRAIYTAFHASDREKLEQLIAADVIWHGNEGNPNFGGTINGLQEFFGQAFKYKEALKSVEVVSEAILTDGKVVMSRQRDVITRLDGTKVTYMFNVYYEFNEKNQEKEVLEATTSDWRNFP